MITREQLMAMTRAERNQYFDDLLSRGQQVVAKSQARLEEVTAQMNVITERLANGEVTRKNLPDGDSARSRLDTWITEGKALYESLNQEFEEITSHMDKGMDSLVRLRAYQQLINDFVED